jgi:hypothetical protein
MARKFYTPIDLNGLEIQNVRIQNLASAPGSPAGEGQIYYNTSNDTLYVYDGSSWQAAGKIGAGSLSARPTAGSAGRIFFATDENVLYYDNGTTWSQAGVKQGDFDTLEGRVSTTEGDISSLDGRLSTAEGDISSLQSDASALEGRVSTAEGDISSLEGRVSTTESDISDLQSDVSTLQSDVSSLDGRLSTAEGDISSLQSDLSDHVNATTSVHGISDTADLVYQSDLSGAITDLESYADSAASTAEQNAKDYADAISQGLDVKQSVRAATVASITLSGTQTIDDVSVVAGDRVLVKDQGADNGIYVVAAGAWSRAEDADDSTKVTAGLFTFVEEGTDNGNNGYVLTTDGPIVLGTTSLTFTQFSGAGQVAAGDGLTKSGNTLNVVAGTGIVVNSDDVAIDTEVVARKVVFTDITATVTSSPVTLTLTHGLDNRDVAVDVYDDSSYDDVVCDVVRTTANAVELTFYASGSFRAVVVG